MRAPLAIATRAPVKAPPPAVSPPPPPPASPSRPDPGLQSPSRPGILAFPPVRLRGPRTRPSSPPPSPPAPGMIALGAPPNTAPAVYTPPAVHIDSYDGPLDLLLFLIRREGVDVRNIPVARICDAYLSFLDDAEVIDVDQAGDYLLMAATLCQLKARELLPRAPGAAAAEEDEEDPKERLTRRLLEYERYRLAAEELGGMARLDRDVFARPAAPVPADEVPLEPGTDALGLLRLYYQLEARHAAPPPVHEVRREPMKLATAVRWILDQLDDGGEHQLSELFVRLAEGEGPGAGQALRPRRIFTFLATLEMARLRFLDVAQHVHLGAVRIVGRVRRADADLSALPEDDEPPPADTAPAEPRRGR